MISLYTETLKDYFEHKQVNNDYPAEILTLMEKIPSFTFVDSDNGINVSFSFKTLFNDKYWLREIGAETEEMFQHFLRMKLQRIIVELVPKISMWLTNFKDLFKFTVKLEEDNSSNATSGGSTVFYLNPINKGNASPVEATTTETGTTRTYASNLKTQDVSGNETSAQGTQHKERDVLQTVWGKTRATLMQQIFDLEDIYMSAIDMCESCFMSVY